MGLDQYAFKRKLKKSEEIMYWRKHSKLQQWYVETFGKDIGEVILNKEHIKEIRELTKNDRMPYCEGGFFWGSQFQDDPEFAKQNKDATLEFCDKALKAIKEGCDVIYGCSW